MAPAHDDPVVREPPREGCHRVLRRFGRDAGGATAIEMAIVLVPFLAILLSTIETAIVFWAQMSLQQAVADTTREIYTGNFQTANANLSKASDLLDAFRKKLCQENGQPRKLIFNCANVKLNISTVDAFSNVAPLSPVTSGSGIRDWNPNFGIGYACGRGNAIVLVQAAVDFPVFSTLLNPGTVTLPGGRRVLQAASVFRVEPYDSTKVCS
ncbi:TadE/TadG family type IV pilus assembly protein [Methylobacterium organophilum]|uniref:TadE-like domain-containing protein n=1 Tax=Methylobacterium organophilum TaxID=410 RepID=A0ABQ4T4A3_METOR|nr:TadE/TadG family type IV pilus assembly protein [Methylobacterium organophilum]GJE25457.1 hypothetical protein LKMONMHP_0295 [Methylobacterium organophilum]